MPVSPVVDDATRRTKVAWLALDDAAPRPVWFVWHAEVLWTVCGGAEQDLDAAATRAVVTVRGKDQVVVWEGAVRQVGPGPEWDEVVPLLHEARLNAADGEDQPLRWARESTLLAVTPTPTPTPPSTDAAGVP
jgi:hypothetical protein